MTLNQMLYFRTLTETHSMGRAAEQLYIAQPSISSAIAKLEDELEVLLFERQGHQMILTPEGEAFLVHVEKILKEAEEAAAHMKRLGHRRESLIRLGCITPLFRSYFPTAMKEFLEMPENQTVRFEFSSANTDELVRRLKNGIFDFLLCSEESDPDLVQLPLLTEPIMLITGEDIPPLTDWRDLEKYPLIGYEPGSVMDRILSRIAVREHLTLNFKYRAPTEHAIASLVDHGLGSALIPWSDILMRDFNIYPHPLPGGNDSRMIYLTTLRRQQPLGAAARFIRYLTADRSMVRKELHGVKKSII